MSLKKEKKSLFAKDKEAVWGKGSGWHINYEKKKRRK